MDRSPERYLDWKHWTDDAFGRFDPLEARYFAQETGIGATPGVRVLEIGFGNGPFIGWASSVGAEVFGVELNAALIARARRFLGEHKAFEGLDDPELTRLTGTFSFVVAFDVIEHIPQDLLSDYFSRLSALLAPDGLIFVRFPNGDSPFGRLYQHADPTHVTTIGREKLRYFARHAGLAIRAIRAPKLPFAGPRFNRALKSASLGAARYLVERCVGLLYFGGRTIPLAPNYLAILSRDDAP